MKVIINEIKKLLNIKSVTMMVIIFLVLWKILVQFWIDYFPEGIPDLPAFNISERMLQEYDTVIDEEEMEDFKAKTALLEKEADKYLLEREEYFNAGIRSYREFVNIYEKNFTKYTIDTEIDQLHSKIMFEDSVYLFWELQEREYLIDIYKKKDQWLLLGRAAENNKAQVNRVNYVINSEDSSSVLSSRICLNYDDIIGMFSIIIVITVAFIISPIFISDNKSRTNYIQYSSKVGRNLANRKVIAAMITTFIVVTIEIAIFLAMYSHNDTFQFWNCSINGVFADITSWYNLTFGQYIVLTIFILYLIAALITSISIYVSSKVNTFISLIGIQLPILVAFSFLLNTVGLRDITAIYLPKYTIHSLYGVMVVIAIGLLFSVLRKERVKDVVN